MARLSLSSSSSLQRKNQKIQLPLICLCEGPPGYLSPLRKVTYPILRFSFLLTDFDTKTYINKHKQKHKDNGNNNAQPQLTSSKLQRHRDRTCGSPDRALAKTKDATHMLGKHSEETLIVSVAIGVLC